MPVLTPPRPRKPRPAPGRAGPAQGAGAKTVKGPKGKGWLDDPDVRLMLRVQGGDGEAFGELEQLYRPRVFGYFCRQLGDRADAEDLTQEVFLRLYRSRRVAALMPNTELLEMPHVKHWPHFEDPDAFNAAAIEFLTR